MASIFGVSVSISDDKPITHSGDVLLHDKKIGEFCEDFWDSKIHSKFDEMNEIETITKKYFKTFGFTQHEEITPTVNDFLKMLLYLKAAEDIFKAQDECSVSMIVDNADIQIAVLPPNSTQENVLKLLEGRTDNKKAYAFLFNNLDDFEVS